MSHGQVCTAVQKSVTVGTLSGTRSQMETDGMEFGYPFPGGWLIQGLGVPPIQQLVGKC